MRSVASLILVSLVAAFVCLGDARVSEDNPCCDSHESQTVNADFRCCQVTTPEAPALLPGKTTTRVWLALLAEPVGSVEPVQPSLLVAGFDLPDRFADRAPSELYLLNAALLI